MPQLDINTFSFQFTGIIFLLISVYTLISYIVLPALLRSMYIRVKLLETTVTIKELVSSINAIFIMPLVLGKKTPLILSSGVSVFLEKISVELRNILLFVLRKTAPTWDAYAVPVQATTFVPAFLSCDFIILFLTIDPRTDDEIEETIEPIIVNL